MKKLTSIILILFLSLLSSPSWSETLSMDDLVERDGLYYKKFTDVPFTGEVTGKFQGSVSDGKSVGEWITYYDNGQLETKVSYNKSGKKAGNWVSYHDNGKLWTKGRFFNGLKLGKWSCYNKKGKIIYTRDYDTNGDMVREITYLKEFNYCDLLFNFN